MSVKQGITLVAIAILAFAAIPSASFAGKKDAKQMRQGLAAMHSDIAAISARYPRSAPEGLGKRARQAQRAVKDLSKDDLALLSDLLHVAPNWPEIPDLLESALEAQEAQLVTIQAPPPNCPAGLPNGILDWFIARDVAQAVDFLQIFAPDDLVAVTPAGGGTISAHPIKIALQVTYEAAQVAALVLEQIYFIADECESNAHQELLRQVDDKINGIEQQFKVVKAAQRQIMRLLLMEDEDRRIDPTVLTCTGDDCPRVLDCPGKECRFLDDDD